MSNYNIVVKESPLARLLSELPQLLTNFQLRQQEMNIEADREARRYTFEREMAEDQRSHESTLLENRFAHEKDITDTKLESQQNQLNARLTAEAENLQTNIDSRFDLLDQELNWKEEQATIERELQAEISHYKDSKAANRQTELLLKEAEAKWNQTGLQLSSLYDTDITDQALTLLDQFSTLEADAYMDKAEWYSDMSENAEKKIDLINDALAGVVRQGSLFATAGGDVGMGWGDPLKWDVADLGYDAFIAQNPNLSDTEKAIAKEWFEVNAPVLSASARELRQDQVNLDKIGATTEYYEQQTKADQTKKLKQAANTYYARRLSKIESIVNLNGIASAERILAKPLEIAGYDPATEEGAKAIAEVKKNVDEAKAQIAIDFSFLIGEEVKGKENPQDYIQMFETMISTARGEKMSNTQFFSEGEYADYMFYLDKAWAHYNTPGLSSADMSKIERLARVYFGFPEGMKFREFMKASKEYYNYSVLGSFDTNVFDDPSNIGQGPTNKEQEDVNKVEDLIRNKELLEELENIIQEQENQ